LVKPYDKNHLFLRNRFAARPFTAPSAGGGKPRRKVHDPADHGRRLQNEYLAALRATDEIDQDAPVRVEFESEPEFALALGSLENGAGRRPIELLAVRQDGTRTFATVLIPRERLKHFAQRFDEYMSKKGRTGSPRHSPLVDSIAHVRRAVFASLWTDLGQPPPRDKRDWYELWLRGGREGSEAIQQLAEARKLPLAKHQLLILDRTITLIRATPAELETLIEESDAIAEVRAAALLASEFLDLSPAERAAWGRDLVGRISWPSDDAPSVCLLDTGVNRGHPLLSPLLSPADMHTLDPQWGTNDQDGHGTQMAGLAAHGDLLLVLGGQGPVVIGHRLESVKLLSPQAANNPEPWGALTLEAISRAEVTAPARRRAICLTVASRETRDRGLPSSWSTALDTLASGAEDGQRRLLCVASGNAPMAGFSNYPTANETEVVHDPGQSWNALTVGALADRDVISDPSLRGWTPIASLHDISPSSSTSLGFQTSPRWPIKPEVVMPGGNAAKDPSGRQIEFVPDLQLLSTSLDPIVQYFAPTGETSAATALAARLGARILARYPTLWPEAVRALIVHSAEWTRPMIARCPGASKVEVERRLRWFGFGVPNSDWALASADNAATLIAQEEIQPFRKKGESETASNVMHLHRLPLPTATLQRLGEQLVEMRVTLSYFIEPSGARRGFSKPHRYSSFGLRFDLQKPAEALSAFSKRINAAAREEGEKPEMGSDSREWVLGRNLRALGSLHSDRWQGTAAALAARAHLAVFPTTGWWRERLKLGRVEKKTRYALVVSVLAPDLDVDLYTEISSQIAVPISIEP
jgi:Subtilase family